jgi:hypothetical protein
MKSCSRGLGIALRDGIDLLLECIGLSTLDPHTASTVWYTESFRDAECQW